MKPSVILRLSSALCVLLVGLALAVAPPSAFAQVSGGTISGQVTDPSGAAVPGAQVVIHNMDTGIVRNVRSNAAGYYSAPNLLPGNYEVSATATGFARALAADVTLNVGAQVAVNLSLPVRSASQAVTVSAAVPAVNTTDATLSGVVGSKAVVSLPLNGRDWTSLAQLEPGVSRILTQPSANVTNSTRLNRGLGAQLTIGGNRPQQNNYLVDGISINDYANAAPGGVLGSDLGVDSVQEFSVITSNAPGSYGLSSGGVINAETRSGTNRFHGSAYDFLRNSALDARNFFDGRDVPPFRRNQFGVSAGGPLIKNRTFIFGNYEGVRQLLGSSNLIFVPTEAAREGHLKSGDIMVSPAVKAYLPLWHLPNGAISGDTGIYSFVADLVSAEDYFTTRLDHSFSASDSMHGTYLFDRGDTKGPDNTNSLVIGTSVRRQMLALEENHIFSSQLLNSFRFGFTRTVADAPQVFGVINPLANDTSLGFFSGAPPGQISVSGIAPFQGGPNGLGEFNYHYNTFQIYEDLNWIHGAHSLSFGFNVERIQSNELGSSHALGQFKFGSLTNFLEDKPTSFTSALSPVIFPRGIRETIFGGYAQDNWHVRPSLSLNLGLRYEMATVPTEVHNLLSTLPSPSNPTPRVGSPYFNNPTLHNFEPRVGLAWTPFPDRKTVIRAAFGMYDVLPLPYLFELPTLLSAPFFKQGAATKLPAGSFPTGAIQYLTGLREAYIQPNPSRNYVMQWNFNVEREISPSVALTVGYIGSEGVHQPIQVTDLNIVLPTLTASGYEWPTPKGSGTTINPTVGNVAGLLWEGTSSYNALQMKLKASLKKHLTFLGSYTWSRNLDTTSSSVAGTTFDNSVTNVPYFATNLIRGLSDFHIGQNLTLSYLWQVPQPGPSMGWAAWPLRGWMWGGIFQVRSGMPFTAQISGDPLGLNTSLPFAYPDRVSGPGCGTAVNPGSVHYLKTDCFAFPSPSTRLGNDGRNTLIGPGLVNFDMTLIKDNPIRSISETFDVQFEAQFFNLMNHTNFSPPLKGNSDVFNQTGKRLANAGVITSTVTTSRQIQFGLRLVW
jgi:Carboxypeptidase regulatory-like domain/TonB dependent receptor-like, beta-barrel